MPCLTCAGSYKPRCHRQLLRPLLAALPTHTHTPNSPSHFPLAPLPASVPPSYQPAWPLSGPRQTLTTSTRSAPCSALPPAIAGCAAQPMDWPHFGPPTRLDGALCRPATTSRGQSQGRHNALSFAVQLPDLIHEPTLVAFLDATSGCESDIGTHAEPTRPAGYLDISLDNAQFNAITALLSLHGPRTTTFYLAKYLRLLTRSGACLSWSSGSRCFCGTTAFPDQNSLHPGNVGLCLRATIHRKAASDHVCVTRTNQPVAATLLCRTHPPTVREGCLGGRQGTNRRCSPLIIS